MKKAHLNRHLIRHLFRTKKEESLWERLFNNPCGLDGTRTRDLRRDRAAF